MATIKSYTDLEQSKKLAEILPVESADMVWANDNDVIVVPYDMAARENVLHDFIPCWSLAALLSFIREIIGYEVLCLDRKTITIKCELGDKPWSIEVNKSNEIDACFEMIIKLYK